jgi:hypothetical protein
MRCGRRKMTIRSSTLRPFIPLDRAFSAVRSLIFQEPGIGHKQIDMSESDRSDRDTTTTASNDTYALWPTMGREAVVFVGERCLSRTCSCVAVSVRTDVVMSMVGLHCLG